MPVAIYPIQRSNRVRAQRGWFTIQGSRRQSLEVQAPESVAQVLIPDSATSQARKFLERNDKVQLTVQRNGAQQSVTVTLGDTPQ